MCWIYDKKKGTFSTVYRAVDLEYDKYVNHWDYDSKHASKWHSPPLKRQRGMDVTKGGNTIAAASNTKHKYVALKRIYVTSSPSRIYNELKVLHDLVYVIKILFLMEVLKSRRGSDTVVPLITAFRYEDQLIAVLPFFQHTDFRVSLREVFCQSC